MDRVKIRIESVVHPTEDEDKVSRAIRNTLGEVNLESTPQKRGLLLRAEAEDLEALTHLKRGLKRQRIRDAARALLKRSMRGGTVSFSLNKQAAYAGRISFSTSGESPLGPIMVVIECDDLEAVVEWLTSMSATSAKRRIL